MADAPTFVLALPPRPGLSQIGNITVIRCLIHPSTEESDMSVAADSVASPAASRPVLDRKPGRATTLIFLLLLIIGAAYTTYSLVIDISTAEPGAVAILPFVLLGVALLIALGFEFVNGFHDTANAVATVIYTHSLPPNFAVLYSGTLNFLGVLFSSGAVAFGIISLLPVELILQVGSGAGFAMVFALLIAAIIWNLGTWWLGLPASSSHTLIGSIIGVGVANALMHGRDGTSGVDWGQAIKVGYSLLLSPVVGFVCAALLLLVLKALVRKPELYQAPKGNKAPPAWIRGLLVLTCGGVSFAHGSNDGQKGMGLIMLILIGTAPIAYALNRAMPQAQMTPFVAMATATQQSLERYAAAPVPADPRAVLTSYVRTHTYNAQVIPAIATLTGSIAAQVRGSGTFAKDARRRGHQRAQRHVPDVGGAAPLRQGPAQRRARCRHTSQSHRFQEGDRPLHEVHTPVGQGGGGDRSRTRHHGRLEAHRRDDR